jgi:cyclohexa-1,5-dienecarbonyl-CoA hydratase
VELSKLKTERFLGGQGLRVVLNDPKGNVLDATMLGQINGLLDGLADDRELKLLCFEGAGDHFSFGASVAEHVREQAPAMLEVFHGMFRRLIKLAVPCAAAVRGRCLGGGMELATFCHRVAAHPKAVLGQPEIQLGVLPPVASLILPQRVGQARADDLVLTGRNVDGATALEMGLIDELSEDPSKAIEAWAETHLAPKSASSLRWAVKASRWSFHQTVLRELEALEKLYLEGLMGTHDANEGLAAFLGKRAVVWENR